MNKSIYGFILRYSKRQQIIISLITLASFPFIYVALILPKIIINDAIGGSDFPMSFYGVSLTQQGYLITLCVSLLVLYLINGLFLMGLNTFKNSTSERMTRRLRYMLFQRILRFPTQHFERVSQGELSTMIAGEVELIREFISDAFAMPLFQGGTLLVILFFMFTQDPVLGFASIVLIPVQAYITPKFQRRINLLGKDRVERARKLSGRVSEAVSGIRDLRSNQTYQFTLADFSKHLEGIYYVRFRIFQIKFFMKFLNNFMLKLTPLLFYAVGGILIINGRLSLGALVAVIAAYSQLTAPWRELLRYYQRRGDASIKYEQLVNSFEIDTLLSDKTLEPDATSSELDQPITGRLELHDVSVDLEDGSKALDQISLQADPGTKLAIVATGVSREKLAHAITGLIATDGGQVLIDEQPIAGISSGARAAGIGYLGTDSYVFDGTIGYNSIYGLQRKVPARQDDGSYDLDEARASGNSLFDAGADWTDLTIAKVEDRSQLTNWWFEIICAVDLKDLLFQRALSGTVTPESSSDLPEKVIAARKTIAQHPKLQELVHPFDYDSYNPNASIASNIAFGEPRGAAYDLTRFGEFPLVRDALASVGLYDEFQAMGVEMSRKLIDLFGDADQDNALLKRFQFVSAATLDVLRDIVRRADKKGLASLKKQDRAQLVSLVCQLVVERHRLGICDEPMLDKIIAARKYFNDNLPDNERELIASYDPEGFNDRLSLRGNLLMGRVNLSRARAEQQVNEIIKEIITDLGIEKSVILSAFGVECGIAGQSLPLAARQSLNLARNMLKRPKILVINDGLSGHDREARSRILKNVVKLLPDMLLVWIESEMPPAEFFDQIITLRNGRIADHIGAAAPVGPRDDLALPEPPVTDTPMPDTGPALDAEARVLSQISLFQGIAPANLKLLAFGSQRVRFQPGEFLTREGIVGKTAYVILSGQVDVILRHGTPEAQHVATIGKHDLHGETALLAAVPRTASGQAATTVDALEIDKELFLTLMESDAKVATNVARLASERLASTLAQLEQAA